MEDEKLGVTAMEWMRTIGFSALGLVIGLVPISVKTLNAYTNFQIEQDRIKTQIQNLKEGQGQILNELKRLKR